MISPPGKKKSARADAFTGEGAPGAVRSVLRWVLVVMCFAAFRHQWQGHGAMPSRRRTAP
ncbi:MAG: hypothetical protein DBX61_08735 [Clostridiales bacterium]|nr:MAG: hypothetical protein DBX61_08735 [Clostridiales bacterium]